MSAKKEASKSAPAAKAAPVKKTKVDQASKIKRNADGSKTMKVARGTERERRRAGLRKDWKNIGNAAKMLPSKAEVEAQAAA